MMRRARKPINQINVVPYIDVMLVLLVIFMITAPLVNPGQIELPTVGSKLSAPVAPIEIQVRLDQTLTMKEGSAPPQRMSREEIIARIRARQAANAEQAVVIAADKSARYEQVIEVIDMLQRNGVHKVGLLAKSPS
jgi:biopolymer transport protein TolR